MSDRRDSDSDELDDWFADDAGNPGGGESEATPAGDETELPPEQGIPYAEEVAEDSADSSREERRREREARRLEQPGAGAAGPAAGGSGLGGALRRLFSRGAGDRGGSPAGEMAPGQGGGDPAGDPGGEGAGAFEGGEDVLGGATGVDRGARAARRGRGSKPTSYARRRVFAGAAVLGAIALVVVVIVVVGSIGGSDEVPQPVAVPTIDVTIPEGLSREQIADLAKEAGVRGNYKADSKSSKKIDLAEYGAKGAKTLEGFLFPATYELNEDGTTKQLVTRQLEAFEQNIKDVPMKYAKSKNLTTYDILKIASMIEREILVPKERRLASAVIYNRLAAGQPLGIDSTIRFEDGNYDKQLTRERLETDSAFNTRLRTGLPPTPIGNPGLASIEAAANPKRNDVRFFVVKPGTCGEHLFTASEEEFLQAEAEYQQALEREGGSPTDCPE
jgi:UPF0755 protein